MTIMLMLMMTMMMNARTPSKVRLAEEEGRARRAQEEAEASARIARSPLHIILTSYILFLEKPFTKKVVSFSVHI